MTEPTWLATLPAAKAVVLHAATTDEARELLDMLGLVDGGRIVPDDTRQYDIEGAQPVKTTPKGAHLWEPPDHTETFTSPPALRVLPPPEQPKPRPAKGKTAKPRVRKSRAVPPEQHKPRKKTPCGTVSAAARHRRHGEPMCEPCKEASNAYDRERWHRRNPDRPPRRQSVCGTFGGYAAHKRRGEDACEPCKVAMRAYFRARYAAKVTGRAEFDRLRNAGVNGASAAILARLENAEEGVA